MNRDRQERRAWGESSEEAEAQVGLFCDILPITYHSLSNFSFNIVIIDRRDTDDGVVTSKYWSYKIT